MKYCKCLYTNKCQSTTQWCLESDNPFVYRMFCKEAYLSEQEFIAYSLCLQIVDKNDAEHSLMAASILLDHRLERRQVTERSRPGTNSVKERERLLEQTKDYAQKRVKDLWVRRAYLNSIEGRKCTSETQMQCLW